MAGILRGLVWAPAGCAALLAAGLTAPAAAQSDADARCMALPTQAEQIACLRDALADAQGAPAPAQPAAPAAFPPTTAPEAEDRDDGPGIRIPLPSLGLFGGGDDDKDRAEAAAPPTVADEDAFGAEQVAAARNRPAPQDAGEEARLISAITGFEADRRGLLTLELANGQVWRQAERTGVPVRLSRSRSYTAELSESGFGGYRMQIPELDRRIVVERIR